MSLVIKATTLDNTEVTLDVNSQKTYNVSTTVVDTFKTMYSGKDVTIVMSGGQYLYDGYNFFKDVKVTDA